jgi:hypothetical protein
MSFLSVNFDKQTHDTFCSCGKIKPFSFSMVCEECFLKNERWAFEAQQRRMEFFISAPPKRNKECGEINQKISNQSEKNRKKRQKKKDRKALRLLL